MKEYQYLALRRDPRAGKNKPIPASHLIQLGLWTIAARGAYTYLTHVMDSLIQQTGTDRTAEENMLIRATTNSHKWDPQETCTWMYECLKWFNENVIWLDPEDVTDEDEDPAEDESMHHYKVVTTIEETKPEGITVFTFENPNKK